MSDAPASASPVDLRIEAGRIALFAGDKPRAQELLQSVVDEEPGNAEAWLWLSGTYAEPEQIARCLGRVLEIDPDNQAAREGLQWVKESSPYDPDHATAPPPDVPQGAPLSISDPPPTVAPTETAVATPRQPVTRQPATTRPPIAPAAEARGQRRDVPVSGHGEPDTAIYRRRMEQALAEKQGTSARVYASPRTYRDDLAADKLPLVEAGLHVGTVGALLGLLRLAGTLRPGTLLLLRGPVGALDLPAALGVALLSALLHGAAAVVIWLVLGRSIAGTRTDRTGDVEDSLLRAGQVALPGYLLAAALLLAALGLPAGEERWRLLSVAIWALLLVVGFLMTSRLARTLDSLRLRRERPVVRLLQVMLPAVLLGIMLLGLAGLAVQGLLRRL